MRRPEAWWGGLRLNEETRGLMRRPEAWWGGLKLDEEAWSLMRRPEAWWGGLWLDEEAWSLMRRPKAWGGALGLRSEKETVGLRRKRSNVGGLREKIEVWGGGGLWGGGGAWGMRRRLGSLDGGLRPDEKPEASLIWKSFCQTIFYDWKVKEVLSNMQYAWLLAGTTKLYQKPLGALHLKALQYV